MAIPPNCTRAICKQNLSINGVLSFFKDHEYPVQTTSLGNVFIMDEVCEIHHAYKYENFTNFFEWI